MPRRGLSHAGRDRVCLCLREPPKHDVSKVVGRLKGRGSMILRVRTGFILIDKMIDGWNPKGESEHIKFFM